ncbi:hypothetical protein [Salinicola aestuarinus]|nr:hypothetical protein [Salinicola aestuarinus]
MKVNQVFDQALFLLLITAGLNMLVDAISHRFRPRDVPLDEPCT